MNGEIQITLKFDLDKHGVLVDVFDTRHDTEHDNMFKRSQGDSIVEFLRTQRGDAPA
jgi:uncharacterized protein with NRDE domain